MRVEVTCTGHANIRASHHKTLELTAAADVTTRATCVVGVRAELPVAELLRLRGEVELTLESGDAVDRLRARVTPFYLGGDDLVVRRGPPLRQRTFAGQATKGAADLAPELVAALRRGETLRVTVEETGRGAGPGALFVVSLPIGNLGDLTPRARQALRAADLVLAEDTRRYRSLARDAGLPIADLASHHAANEHAAVAAVVDRLGSGDRVALVSDAGTPVLADPGYLLVDACWAAGVEVSPVPGPSALLTAVAAAGVPADDLRFVGFLPRRVGERRRVLGGLAGTSSTTVAFESPNRVAATLADIAELLDDPVVVVARELTKVHEDLRRGHASELAAGAAGDDDGLGVGEHTLIIPPASGDQADGGRPDVDDRLLTALSRAGVSPRTLVDALREAAGTPRNEAYERVLGLVERPDDAG